MATGRAFSMASAAPRTPAIAASTVLADSPAVVAAVGRRRLLAAPLNTDAT
jgi:hypothetical protein